MKVLIPLIVLFFVSQQSKAETVYTTRAETKVHSSASTDEATVVGELKSGSMIETVKPDGLFTVVSFIMDGKVKTGFILTSDLGGTETTVGAQSAPVVTAVAPVEPVSQPPAELKKVDDVSKLTAMSISAADLANFAKAGKLVSRRPKTKGGS